MASKRVTDKIKKHSLLYGVKFDSELEVDCYNELVKHKIPFTFNKEVFTILDGFEYLGDNWEKGNGKNSKFAKKKKANRPLTYKPDFVLHKHKAIIETKGTFFQRRDWPIRRKLFLLNLKKLGMGDYGFYVPKNKSDIQKTIEIILLNGQ